MIHTPKETQILEFLWERSGKFVEKMLTQYINEIKYLLLFYPEGCWLEIPSLPGLYKVAVNEQGFVYLFDGVEYENPVTSIELCIAVLDALYLGQVYKDKDKRKGYSKPHKPGRNPKNQ